MKNLIIITPCSRPENLMKLYDSICMGMIEQPVWYISRDSDVDAFNMFENVEFPIGHTCIKGGVSGNLQRNHVLDFLDRVNAKNRWVYFLDDDNLMHPDFLKTISAAIDQFPDARCFTFSQELPDGSIRFGNDIRVCHIDQAQYCIHTDLIGENRFVQQYEADGIFIEEIYNESPEKFVILPQVISYYNKLKW